MKKKRIFFQNIPLHSNLINSQLHIKSSIWPNDGSTEILERKWKSFHLEIGVNRISIGSLHLVVTFDSIEFYNSD